MATTNKEKEWTSVHARPWPEVGMELVRSTNNVRVDPGPIVDCGSPWGLVGLGESANRGAGSRTVDPPRG